MTADDDPTRAPSQKRAIRHPEFEAELGSRIRHIRVAGGITQAALAAALGMSFQQIQKYENGTDRVAVGTLNAMAFFLGVSPIAFFSDDPDLMPRPRIEMPEAQRIGERVLAIRDPKLVRRIMSLVDTLARDERIGRDLDDDDHEDPDMAH